MGDSESSRAQELGKDNEAGPSGTTREAKAAGIIQKHWRKYKGREEVKGKRISTDSRWDDLKKQSAEKKYAEQQLDNQNDVRSRWHRAAQAAARLQTGDALEPLESTPEERGSSDAPELDDDTLRDRRATFWGSLSIGKAEERDENEELPYQSKALEQQHWLEMIDGKHRYGSNLKYYFRRWKMDADTEDNFFRWLDRGGGKNLDLEELPRATLEKERILYLSAEQRLNYLVNVDKDGLLRWDHNKELVDTARKKWKDAGNGGGIVPNDEDGDSQPVNTKDTNGQDGSDSDESDEREDDDESDSDTYSATSDLDENEQTHYLGLDERRQKMNWLQRKKDEITPNGLRKELLRKTVRRNTWIYVSDMKLNMFVGMKQTGVFQHSSFLAGGKVTSAGIIVVKRGLIKSLNPLSGHYRSSINHYRAFIAQLEAKGVDLSHVKIAKSVLSLWGLSKYAEVTKGEKDLANRFKSALGLPHAPTEMEKSQALEENAEQEEEEHQQRMEELKEAEDRETTKEGKERVRREILYGNEKEIKEEKKEDTARDARDP